MILIITPPYTLNWETRWFSKILHFLFSPDLIHQYSQRSSSPLLPASLNHLLCFPLISFHRVHPSSVLLPPILSVHLHKLMSCRPPSLYAFPHIHHFMSQAPLHIPFSWSAQPHRSFHVILIRKQIRPIFSPQHEHLIAQKVHNQISWVPHGKGGDVSTFIS